MESILLLVLFTYPGAIAEYVYSNLARKRSFYAKPDEMFRVARAFFLSAMVTTVCLVLSGVGSIQGLMTALQETISLLCYLLLSVGVSALTGVVWYGAACACFALRNRYRQVVEQPAEGARRTVWESFLNDPHIQNTNVIVAVYQGGQLLRAGLAYELSKDLETDPGAILMHTTLVENDLRRDLEERTLVGPPIASYLDVSTGTDIALFDGNLTMDYILGEGKFTSSEAAPATESQA